MDTSNQTTTGATEQLKQWWATKTFEGKEFCSLDENGDLRIVPFSDKVISKLNHVTGDAVIQGLIDKFKDLEKQVQELGQEWSQNEDKLRLMGKVHRLHDYAKSINAIGHFEEILSSIKNYEQTIQDIIEANYKEKVDFLKEAEAIVIDNNWKEATQKFKELSEKWKTIGFVDKKRNEALWEKFELLKTKFFENKRQHQDDIEKEMLQNLDLKMELVEKAEAIAASENWKETTETFKQLFQEWKSIGRTMADKNESLWQKYIAAQNSFFERKRLHTDNIKAEQEENYLKKTAIVESAEAIKESTDWNITTKAFNELMDNWKAIGPTPAEHGNILWDRFSAAKDFFFNAKRIQADAFKKMLEENYAKKAALVERIEAIKNNTHWRETTEEMNLLFDQWKQVGQVGKEFSDTLWEKFISARKHFFNRKDQDRERRKAQYEKNKELDLIEQKNQLKNLEFESKDEEAQIMEFKNNLEATIQGPKSEEIKEHLSKLILEIEQRIKDRAPKIERLKAQIGLAEQEANKTENKNANE
jgi:hypothetical protein